MVLDIDHFKRLNDAHGHAAGDAVLCAVARSLAATVRPADVLARTGGEELVVLGLVGDPDEARRLAERLRLAVAHTRTPDGHGVTASIGVALTRPSTARTRPTRSGGWSTAPTRRCTRPSSRAVTRWRRWGFRTPGRRSPWRATPGHGRGL